MCMPENRFAGYDQSGIAIMPFMAVLANPELVEINVFLNTAFTQLGFSDARHFLFMLAVSLAFMGLTTYAQMRFTLMREYNIGKRLVEGCLHQPYIWFLSGIPRIWGKPFSRKSAQSSEMVLLP